MPERAESANDSRRVRCAIYTRKSTEAGLEQEFNSLDAQRAAGETFIRSQQGQGWFALPDRYDDGGATGSDMERPALRKLMASIEAGQVDCVVVYKVDRLSRSLLDFARMMGTFEKYGVSFVSVTQQFNTSAPVGRLTLHILLSFAQFEREIISERTRDKQSAARRRGKWTGGYLVLGYDLDAQRKRLVINAGEARQVRTLYRLYAELGSPAAAVKEAQRKGWRMKSWVTQKGKRHAGRAFTEESLERLLRNPVYQGSILNKGELCKGEHAAIVDAALWERVNERIRQNAEQPKPRKTRASSAPVSRLQHHRAVPRKRKGADEDAARPALPRITRLMALAIKLDGMLREGVLSGYEQVSKLGHVSRARVTQIMRLLHLAPDIQEQLLFLPAAAQGGNRISEPMLRKLSREHDWEQQRRIFKRHAA